MTLGETWIWIQCIEAPEKHPGRLGHFVPLIYATEAQMPALPLQLADAETLAARQIQTYGGKWRVLQGYTYLQMQQARQEWMGAAKEPEAPVESADEPLEIPF